ncbi:MAG: M55 family metallopeptidase [Polyangiales bacterium]
MHVYVSVDMEGVAGIVHVDQTRRTGHDYERARRWMTLEANAAVLGAFDADATSVLVNDSHGDMRNLVLEDLDPRAEILSGSLKPLSMVQGVDRAQGVALFVGYHAGAGTRAGILDHTYYGRVVARCRLGGREVNEAVLNAIVCGDHGVPVALVTGDSTVCAQAREAFGDSVITVSVKDAITRYSARSISPELARTKIRDGAKRAVERARTIPPYRPAPPHVLEIDFVNSACADAAELVPGTRRLSGLVTQYEAPDGDTLIRVIQAWTILAGSTIV